MKAKPDISGFVSAKDPTAFLEGGAGDHANRGGAQASTAVSAPASPIKPEPTVQKLFRLRWDIANALKLGAAESSVASGRRVTETEVIEELLCAHYKLPK